MAIIKRTALIRDLNFWLSVITEKAEVGKSKMPTGKTVTDVQRLDYIRHRLQSAGAKMMRESIERDKAEGPPTQTRYQLDG